MGSVLLTEGVVTNSFTLLNKLSKYVNLEIFEETVLSLIRPSRQDVFEESSGKEWNRGTKD